MKKHWLITAAAVISLLASCPHPSNNIPNIKPDEPDNPNQKATIVFENTQGICTVSVYGYYSREEEDKIAEVLPGQSSGEIEWTPGDSVPFYFSYSISLKGISGFTLDYVPEIGKDQKAVRIDADTTTNVAVPKLNETLPSSSEPLSNSSYLLILNNSSYSFELHQGNSSVKPDNSPLSPLVNTGERGQYKINPGAASNYRLLVSADYKTFSGSLVNFEAGRVYSYIFDGSTSLVSETELILENVADIS
ncbi:MAG: hypothetical protein LBG95_03705, partial [Treponema sp.]|nr:hypothetical protein [Treponema sp.]